MTQMQTPSLRKSQAHSPEDRIGTERVLAAARALLSLAGLVAVRPELLGTGRLAPLAHPMLTAYAVFSVLVLLLTRVVPSWFRAAGYPLHAVDLVCMVSIAVLTQGLVAPFFVFFAFVLFGAAARWGFVETLTTGILMILLFVAETTLASRLLDTESMTVTSAVMSTWYLLIPTLVLGFIAEHQKATRLERDLLSRVLVGIERAPSLPAGLRLLVDACLAHFGASAALLVFESAQTGQLYLWHGARTANGTDTMPPMQELAAAHQQAYLAPAPGNVPHWYVRRTGSGALVGRGIRSPTAWSARRIDGGFSAAIFSRYEATSLLGADSLDAHEWRARFVLIDPSRHGAVDLRFLRLLVSHVSPALYNQYLVRRVRSRVSAMERARLARELHDGVIQSLIGLEMEIEVLRRQSSSSDIPEVRLRGVRDQLRRAIGDVRDLVLQLRPVAETGRDVQRLVAELAGRLRRDVGLDVRLLSTVHELDCRPRTCRELARLIQEALTNVRKHSGARSVVISLSQSEAMNRLVIEDDGRGFGFEGRWSLEQLETSERGPAVIKERVRAMGGTLVIDSQRGRGVRIEVEWQRTTE
jgi:signal transduction histidine kinase